jgi:hypothetical protein
VIVSPAFRPTGGSQCSGKCELYDSESGCRQCLRSRGCGYSCNIRVYRGQKAICSIVAPFTCTYVPVYSCVCG